MYLHGFTVTMALPYSIQVISGHYARCPFLHGSPALVPGACISRAKAWKLRRSGTVATVPALNRLNAQRCLVSMRHATFATNPHKSCKCKCHQGPRCFLELVGLKTVHVILFCSKLSVTGMTQSLASAWPYMVPPTLGPCSTKASHTDRGVTGDEGHDEGHDES